MSARPDVELESLRRNIAAARGLDADALNFVSGSNVDEIEASADALATLIDTSGESQQDSTAELGLFADIAATTARRKQALTALFCGRGPQPRDEPGRFAPRAASFDGGARAPVPIAKPPEQAHAELLGHLIAASRMYRGGADF